MREILKNEVIEFFIDTEFIKASFYKPEKQEPIKKIFLRKILLKNKEFYQFEIFKNNQAFHKNIDKENLQTEIENIFDKFKQIEIINKEKKIILLKNKKGIIRMKEIEEKTDKKIVLSHNKEKNYILELEPIPEFLKVLNLFFCLPFLKYKKVYLKRLAYCLRLRN